MDFIEFLNIPNEDILNDVIEVYRDIFGKVDSEDFKNRIEKAIDLTFIVAIKDKKVIAFKIGYRMNKSKYYSWLGAVKKEYQNNGIANQLMKRQHRIAKEKGYKVIQTKTQNKWKAMLILNLKHGFDIIGIYTDSKNEPKIILEKKL